MKIGLILECTQDGPDVHVCTHLIKMINAQFNLNLELAVPATLTNKIGLITNCGTAAKNLIDIEHCDRVIIVWDLEGRQQHGRSNCLGQDRDDIFAALKAAEVDLEKIKLVGIRKELESWLIADGRALEGCLTQLTRRPVGRIRAASRPEQEYDPKSWLSRVFRENGAREYKDFLHARKIVEQLPDFRDIKTCETFVRFVLKVADKEV